jgi:hypothetical protein
MSKEIDKLINQHYYFPWGLCDWIMASAIERYYL